MINRVLKRFDLFVQPRLYWLLAIICALFILAYPFGYLFQPAKLSFTIVLFCGAVDLFLLFIPNNPVRAERHVGDKWSLGDDNKVSISIANKSPLIWRVIVYDELPFELQERNFKIKVLLTPFSSEILPYTIRPVKRGEYLFGSLRVLLRSPIGIFGRRLTMDNAKAVAVYPSVIQMKKYGLNMVNRLSRFYGVKKIRRIGLSFEFEQIKDYVLGDDIRHINWKATGRSSNLKSNHYIEERSQPVYCIIDKSRVMNMAFNGMSLLDYAINSSLVISNVALQKGDRAGLIAFSEKIGAALRADNSPGQLRRILDLLYAQKYRSTEADYEFLYNATRRIASSRSLLFLFTNFESMYALQRVLPVLRRLNKTHLLIVIFFTNSELEEYAFEPAKSVKEIYNHVIARQMISDKRQMAIELSNHGIQTVLTRPEDLSISVLNRYLELKAKGVI